MKKNLVKETLSGTVVFIKSNQGSKSEGMKPYLYQDKEHCIPLFKAGDNPFENNGLEPFDGQKVTVTGAVDRKVFVVETITPSTAVTDKKITEDSAESPVECKPEEKQ